MMTFSGAAVAAVQPSEPSLSAPVGNLDAWSAAKLMGIGTNIGNTLDNTKSWETGWGNPRITKDYIQRLAALGSLGFRTVRLPVAWDAFAQGGRIDPGKLARVGEIVDWVSQAGMFCVVNIHWDGGWIDSDDRKRFARTYHRFSPEAERKYRSYWNQVASYFAGRDQHLIFEGLNEETAFDGAGSEEKAYATLAHVNQLFIDIVRNSGGNNATRLLIVPGYSTDILKTTNGHFTLPNDPAPHRLFLSVHYYTPWAFAGLDRDADGQRMRPSWGSAADVAELNALFDRMSEFSHREDIPVFLGEFAPNPRKERASRVRWMLAVAQGALARRMVPVLWETGKDISRKPPYAPSPALSEVLQKLGSSPRALAD